MNARAVRLHLAFPPHSPLWSIKCRSIRLRDFENDRARQGIIVLEHTILPFRPRPDQQEYKAGIRLRRGNVSSCAKFIPCAPSGVVGMNFTSDGGMFIDDRQWINVHASTS